MRQKRITYLEVQEVIKELESEGLHATNKSIRKRLGRGSYSTIAKYSKKIEDDVAHDFGFDDLTRDFLVEQCLSQGNGQKEEWEVEKIGIIKQLDRLELQQKQSDLTIEHQKEVLRELKESIMIQKQDLITLLSLLERETGRSLIAQDDQPAPPN